MPPLTKQHVSRLLSVVKGKPHATSDDHEDAGEMERYQKTLLTENEEDFINGEPLSSGDEEIASKEKIPPPETSQASTAPNRSKSNRTDASHVSKKTKKTAKIQPPRQGAYKRGQTDKAKRGRREDEKENGGEDSQPLNLEKNEGSDVMFDNYAYGGSQNKKQRIGYTANIHAPQKKSKAYGAPRGSKTLATKKSSQQDTLNSWRVIKEPKDDGDDDDNDSDVSMVSLKLAPKDGKSKTKAQSKPKSPSPPRTNPLEHLGAYASSQPSAAGLPNLDPQGSGSSSALSDAPSPGPTPLHESLQNIEKYLQELPSDSTDDKCPLCQAPISQDYYYTFWKDKRKTVRNQQLFCKEHKRHSAFIEYKKAGYPEVDWDSLAARIMNFKSQMEAVLRNTTTSQYRAKHAETLSSGREHTVRKMLKHDSSPMDSSTGYYGPRGKRIMMEVLTLELADVVRETSATDPVVGRSGFATFFQAVLVPELTILLIKEDMEDGEDGGISEEMAIEIIRESERVGSLVNEEIEDEVARVESGSEDEGGSAGSGSGDEDG